MANRNKNPGEDVYEKQTDFEERQLQRKALEKAVASSDKEAAKEAVEKLSESGDLDAAQAAREALEKRESEGDSLYKDGESATGFKRGDRGRLKGFVSRVGPSGGIVALLLGLFSLGSVTLGPISLLTNLFSVAQNHTDLGNHLFHNTSKSFVAAFLKGSNRDCTTSKLKCKFATISDKRLKQWEARGIKVTADRSVIPGATGGDRWKIRSLEFPNGRKVSTLRQYNSLRLVDPVADSLLKRFPIRATYLNKKSSMTKAVSKLGGKQNKFRSSKKPDKSERVEENSKAMDSHTGSSADPDERTRLINSRGSDKENRATADAKNKIKSFKTGAVVASTLSLPVVASCWVYDIIRATQAAMILLWHEELIKFGLPFLQAGSQAKEAGVNEDFDWETAEYYGDRLMTPVTKKDADRDPDDNITPDMIGKTAMDSKGLGAALNGDPVLNDRYSGWAPIKDVYGIGVVKTIQDKIGKDNIRTTCKTAQIAAYLGLAGCLAGPQAVAKCLAGIVLQQAIAQIWGDDIVKLIVNQLSEPALKAMAKANLSSSLVGPPLGDAIISASGVMSSYADRASGFAVAGNTEEAYLAYNDMLNNTDYTQTKLARDRRDAAHHQLDPRNPHSFAGILTSQIISQPWDGTLYSAFANITNTVAAIPSTLFSNKTSAYQQGVFQPVQVYHTRSLFEGAVANCTSPGPNDAGFPCLGESGRAIPMLLSPVKECIIDEAESDEGRVCINEAIDYLSNKKYIDKDTGKPTEEYSKDKDDYDNVFLMYMRHCGIDREYPLGYTDKSIDSENIDWYDGKKCATSGDKEADTDLAWMSYFYNECIALYASEEDIDYCWEDSASTPSSGGGQWVIPTSGPCLSAYGPRNGSQHAGIDISPPANTPIVAPTDMTITFSGINSGGYGYMVTGKAIDDSGYSFRFGHMIAQPPVKAGQTVTKGTLIGNVGSTGDSSGPHLHFEIFPPGGDPASFSGAVDPVPIMAKYGVNISCKAN